MKKILVLSLVTTLCWALPAYGQLQSKTLFADGDWTFHSDPDHNSLQDYNARAGILVDENLTFGGLVSGQQFNRFNSTGPDINTRHYGLFTRYFFKGNGAAVPFLAGEAFLGNRTFNFDVDELDFNRHFWGFYLGAGVDWFLDPSAAIEGQAGVQRFDEESLDPRTSILADIGLFFFLPPEGESLGRVNLPLSVGLLMIGGRGSLRWEVSGNDTGSSPVIAFHPLFGYQFHPRWMMGSELAFTSGQQVVDGGAILDPSDLSLGFYPFLRLYLNPEDKFKVFAEGMAGAAYQRHDFHNHYPFRLRGSVGADFFLSSHMALEAFFGYQGVRDLDEGTIWKDNFVGGLGLRAFVGQ